MAKSSFVKDIKAKPNARGKTSHLMFACNTKDCKNDAVIFKGTFDKRVKLCYDCFESKANQPSKITDVEMVLTKLRALGMVK